MKTDKNNQSGVGSSDATRSENDMESAHNTGNWLTKPNSEWIRLNVGGKCFTTTRCTLSKDPESFLFRLCQEKMGLQSQKDDTGAYLIDRDPGYFSPILNYLRHGQLVMDKNISEEGVLEEAEFFNIKTLITLLKEKIQKRDLKAQFVERSIRHQSNGHMHVHRLLQCHNNELTNLVSTLSDGWKFEQVINIGLPYPCGDNENAEFLCVVSRQVDQDMPAIMDSKN